MFKRRVFNLLREDAREHRTSKNYMLCRFLLCYKIVDNKRRRVTRNFARTYLYYLCLLLRRRLISHSYALFFLRGINLRQNLQRKSYKQ